MKKSIITKKSVEIQSLSIIIAVFLICGNNKFRSFFFFFLFQTCWRTDATSRWFDLDLFKDLNFISLMICDFCVCIAWQGWVIYIVPHGEEKGLSPYQSSGLAIAGGVGYFIGLMIPALVVDIGYVTDYQARTVSFIASGAAFLIDPWINSFIGQLFLSAICTAAIGVGFTMSMAIAMKVSVENLAQVVSFELFVGAVGNYVGGMFAGTYDLFIYVVMINHLYNRSSYPEIIMSVIQCNIVTGIFFLLKFWQGSTTCI